MSGLTPRVVFAVRESDYERLMARHGTREQARFFLETRGQKIEDVEAPHAELQDALDTIWRVPARPLQGWWHWLRARLLSFGLILGLSFLLLVSLLLGAAMSAAEVWWKPWFGPWLYVAGVANMVISQGLVVAVFALIFKWMPRARIAWRDVLLGALVTAGLFELGRTVIGFYLRKSGVASGFGAAASVVALLVWVYFSAQILLIGAEFTWAYARVLGSRREVEASRLTPPPQAATR